MTAHRIFTTAVASVYPHYVRKVVSEGRKTDFATFFADAPALNPNVHRSASA